ncbi:MAG TPA: protein kinase [Pirellulales bacterium]|jgi:predicted Ser/Thr protein kinase|nr:protein kinase [Pirellulales bacterium]
MSTVHRPNDHVCATCGKLLAPAMLSAAGQCRRCEAEGPPLRSIGKFSVVGRLGAGTMGVVYKCSQPGLDRLVAVKVVRPGQHPAAESALRFEREVRAAAQLSHPNVVQIFDVGAEGEVQYLVMEFVDGPSLDRLIGTPALTIERSLSLIYHLASATAAAHALGMIHRDIKPSNVLLDKSGRPKLADFGLAKSLWDGEPLSRTGDLVGTPCYMSPEQAFDASAEVDARTDVYSLGAVMYEMLTGRRPVDGPTLMSVLYKLAEEDVMPVDELNPKVPDAVRAICQRALAKNRDERFQSASEMAEAVRAYMLAQIGPKSGGLRPAAVPDLLPELVTAVAVRRPLKAATRRWRPLPSLGTAALIAVVSIAVVWGGVYGWWRFGPSRQQLASGLSGARADSSVHAPRPADVPASSEIASGLVAQAREQLAQSIKLPEPELRRQRVQAAIEDLSAALRRTPDSLEARLLRARARRATGEYVAAWDDLNQVLQRQPDNLAALYERLLAAYEFRLLYLGNISEPLVQPRQVAGLAADVNALIERGGGSERRAARLVDALARTEFREAARLADEPSAPDKAGAYPADLAMLEADALLRAAAAAQVEEANSQESERPAKRARRQALQRRADEKLERGLAADPNHAGLLFVKATAMIRKANWEAAEGNPVERVYKSTAFQKVLERFRSATLQAGPDTPLAQAVLLVNLGELDVALEHVNVALSYRPEDPLPYVLKAWLKLSVPRDAPLAAVDIDRLLDDLRPAFEPLPQDFNPFFVRALLETMAGRWDVARTDVFEARRKLGKSEPSNVYAYNQWYSTANGSPTEFLFATQDVLTTCGAAPELRVLLGHELLKRLDDAMLIRREGLDESELQRMIGWTHYHLALCAAEQKDRDGTLSHLREAVGIKLAELSPEAMRQDAAFADWRDDEAFVQLLTSAVQQ